MTTTTTHATDRLEYMTWLGGITEAHFRALVADAERTLRRGDWLYQRWLTAVRNLPPADPDVQNARDARGLFERRPRDHARRGRPPPRGQWLSCPPGSRSPPSTMSRWRSWPAGTSTRPLRPPALTGRGLLPPRRDPPPGAWDDAEQGESEGSPTPADSRRRSGGKPTPSRPLRPEPPGVSKGLADHQGRRHRLRRDRGRRRADVRLPGPFTFRRRGRDADGCKHIKALRALGLIDAEPPA